jgi:hypothetical protein
VPGLQALVDAFRAAVLASDIMLAVLVTLLTATAPSQQARHNMHRS